MELLRQYQRLARWNPWANELVFAALRGSEGEPAKALAAFQHTLETEVNWLRRMEAPDLSSPPLWVDPSLELCESYAAEANDRLPRIIARLEAEPGRTFSYRTSDGTEYTNNAPEALMHMFMHSMQYRGEAAAFLNEAGHRVPDMDLIFWLRAGEPQ